MKRIALISASLVLVGGMASACGSSPEDADKDEFCDAVMAMGTAEDEDDFDDKLDKLKDVGTPEEIDGDARKGFEIVIDKVEYNQDEDDIDLSDDEDKQVTAFSTKVGELCSPSMPTPDDMPDLDELESQLGDLEEGTDGLGTE